MLWNGASATKPKAQYMSIKYCGMAPLRPNRRHNTCQSNIVEWRRCDQTEGSIHSFKYCGMAPLRPNLRLNTCQSNIVWCREWRRCDQTHGSLSNHNAITLCWNDATATKPNYSCSWSLVFPCELIALLFKLFLNFLPLLYASQPYSIFSSSIMLILPA